MSSFPTEKEAAAVVVAAAAAATANVKKPATAALLSTAQVCAVIRQELENVRRAVLCSICLSCVVQPVVVPACMHAYCQPCLNKVLDAAAKEKCCPICKTPANRRSYQEAPYLSSVVTAYKTATRAFGLAPAVFVKDLPTLTQQVPDTDDDDDNLDSDNEHNIDDTVDASQKRKDAQDQYEASRTFARFLPKAVPEPPLRQRPHSTNHSPPQCPTKSPPLDLIHAEQLRIVECNQQYLNEQAAKRAAIRAVKGTTTPTGAAVAARAADATTTARKNNRAAIGLDDDGPLSSTAMTPGFSQIMYQGQSQEAANHAMEDSEEDDDDRKPAAIVAASSAVVLNGHLQNPLTTPPKGATRNESSQQRRRTIAEILQEAEGTASSDESDVDDNNGKRNCAIAATRMATTKPAVLASTACDDDKNNGSLESSVNKTLSQPMSLGIQSQDDDEQFFGTAVQECDDPLELAVALPVAAAAAAAADFAMANGSTVDNHHDPRSSSIHPVLDSAATLEPANVAGRCDAATASLAASFNGDVEAAKPTATSAAVEPFPTPEECSPIQQLLSAEEQQQLQSSISSIRHSPLRPDMNNSRDNNAAVESMELPPEEGTNQPISSPLTSSSAAPAQVTVEQRDESLEANESDDAEPGILEAEVGSVEPPAVMAMDTSPQVAETFNSETQGTVGSDGLAVDSVAPTAVLAVGDVVQVQSRTWPGVNKPGGVAKVTRVHAEPLQDHSLRYDVQYVVDRRREKRVDAIYIALHQDIDAAMKQTQVIEGVARQQTRRPFAVAAANSGSSNQTDDEIPSELKALLLAEGFATDSAATSRALASMKENVQVSNSAMIAGGPGRTSRPAKEKQSRSLKRKVQPDRNVAEGSTDQDSQEQAVGAGARKKTKAPVGSESFHWKLPTWTDSAKCQKANDLYRRRVQAAISKGTVHLSTSCLSEYHMQLLKVLCQTIKSSTQNVRLVTSETIQANKTTLCLAPCGSVCDGNLTTERRSMKVMKASLLGIPIVSVAWIDACLAAKRVKVPTAEMYARTLSAKCSVATESAPSPRFEFGVALLAAAVNETSTKHSSKYALFPKDIMYLVGFSSQNEAAFCSLLRCAGVQDAIVSKQVALSKLKVMSKGNVDDTTRFVVLYAEDSNATLSEALVREIRNNAGRVIVVSSQWLVDSVTCGFAIDPTSYVPKSGSLANEV